LGKFPEKLKEAQVVSCYKKSNALDTVWLFIILLSSTNIISFLVVQVVAFVG
jgi:hypothetical protein